MRSGACVNGWSYPSAAAHKPYTQVVIAAAAAAYQCSAERRERKGESAENIRAARASQYEKAEGGSRALYNQRSLPQSQMSVSLRLLLLLLLLVGCAEYYRHFVPTGETREISKMMRERERETETFAQSRIPQGECAAYYIPALHQRPKIEKYLFLFLESVLAL